MTHDIKTVSCDVCEATFPMMHDEPVGFCPECDSLVVNPNFKAERVFEYSTDAVTAGRFCICEDYPCCGHN